MIADGQIQTGQDLFETLKGIAQAYQFSDFFEDQRRNNGKAFGMANGIREISKAGIVALKNHDAAEVQQCTTDIKANWESLIRLNLPSDMLWQHQAEAGQEMVEFLMVAILYPKLCNRDAQTDIMPVSNDQVIGIPTPEDLSVTYPTWLAGIGDAATELSKMVMGLLLDENLTSEERIAIRKKFLAIAKDISEFLGNFETVYGQIINNSRRRGFGNTYRGVLHRVERVIEIHTEKIVDNLDRQK